jgi:hypothetical protein
MKSPVLGTKCVGSLVSLACPETLWLLDCSGQEISCPTYPKRERMRMEIDSAPLSTWPKSLLCPMIADRTY